LGALFRRGSDPAEITSATGVWLEDVNGRRYLDAASGAMVVNIGHGDRSVISALVRQAEEVAYVHSSAFTTQVSERYADRLAEKLPMDGPRVYPVSGGSEAVETALKVARSYHLARGRTNRDQFIGRAISYHGNTRGALDVGGRDSFRQPYLPWLGVSGRVPAVSEYRCPNPNHPAECGKWHASRLEDEILRIGDDRVAAFIAEPIGGAASGAAVPPDDYWDQVSDVCRRHEVLVIADEVMTGFGRTGAWFASEHFGLRPDIMTMAKGASSGYWPLGVCAFRGEIGEALESEGLVHGLTFSHHPMGAAVGEAVIQRIEALGLVAAAADIGGYLSDRIAAELSDHPHVGDVRGKGLLLAVELVADRASKRPFAREKRVAEGLTARARDLGLVVYPSTGCADGVRGDLLLVGPPLVITREEVEILVDLLVETLEGLT